MVAVPRCRAIVPLTCCFVVMAVSCQPEPPPHAKPPEKPPAAAPQERPSEAEEQSKPDPVETQPAVEPTPEPEVKTPEPHRRHFRPTDRRPNHDDDRLKQAGIGVYESKRLKLYSDIDPKTAATLPPVVDQVYDAWVANLGELPPDRSGTDFQITGYLIRDEELFRTFGLLPPKLFFEHGLHSRNEFWMREQEFDYYRRHLLLHEATHCYMTFVPYPDLPVWYLEGMAEYFASHHVDEQGRVTFCLMPTSAKEFAGFGRIPLIQSEIAANRWLSIDSIFRFTPLEFRSIRYYSWSWALCYFLDQSPKYQERFRELSPLRSHAPFLSSFDEKFASDRKDLATKWALFSSNLQYGYDIRRAQIDFDEGVSLDSKHGERSIVVVADRGWQSTVVRVEKGKRYRITATGKFTLGDQPKPWLSEPQGISFQYFGGRPLGQVVACIWQENDEADLSHDSMLDVITIGRETELPAPLTGTLYIRINDAWNSLVDNHGTVTVTLRQLD